MLKFTGILTSLRNYSAVFVYDPLKTKQLLKGLVQLSEGAVQVFRPQLIMI